MFGIGVQTKNAIDDLNPDIGFKLLKQAGFTNVDFSLNSYLLNTDLYQNTLNKFFDKTEEELFEFFTPFKESAKKFDITVNQMHMPYPVYIPSGKKEVNDYLWNEVVPKSMAVCRFLECPYIVIHGFKMARYLGSEEAEWQQTMKFIDYIAPMAMDSDTVICIENLYDSEGGHLIEGPCCDAEKAARRIDEVNEKYGREVLGFCFDTGHANLVGLDFEKFIVILGHRLKVLHIHDNDGITDLHQIPFTFAKTRENTSSTDWDSFIRGLKRIKYDKVLSFETAPVLTDFPDEMKKNTLEFIAKLGKYFADKIKL